MQIKTTVNNIFVRGTNAQDYSANWVSVDFNALFPIDDILFHSEVIRRQVW